MDALSSIGIGTIIGVPFFAALALFMIVGALIALARGLSKSLMRLASIIVSTALALGATFMCAAIIKNTVGFGFLENIASTLLEGNASKLVSALLGTVVPVATAFISTAVGLLIFVPFFFLFRLIGMIPFFIVKKRVPIFKFKGQRLVAMAVGALCGFIIVVIMFMPLFSAAGFASDLCSRALGTLEKSSGTESRANEVIEIRDEIIDPISSSGAMKLERALGAKALIDGLSTVKINGEKVCMTNESEKIADLVAKAAPIALDPDNIDKNDALSLCDAADSIKSMKILPDLIAAAINELCQEYTSKTETKSGTDRAVGKIADRAVEVFASSDASSVCDDIGTLTEAGRLLIERDAFKIFASLMDKGLDGIDVKEFIGEDGIAKDLIGIFDKNARFKELVGAVKGIFVSTMVEKLDIPDVGDTEYKEMIDDITSFVSDETKTVEEKEEIVKETISKKLKEENIEISPEITEFLSEAIVREFNGKTEITNDDIQKFIASGAFDSISFEDIEEFIK